MPNPGEPDRLATLELTNGTPTEADLELAAAGFTIEEAELWRPLRDDVPGKTWWAARRLP